jgi:hypothetical protein
MAVEVDAVRSRRAVIAGALGGAMALAAHALGRPMAARAGIDGDVVLGASNTTTTMTTVTSTGAGIALKARGTSAGVWGESTNSVGVAGIGQIGAGVHGASYATNRPGVQGVALGAGTGVFGRSGGYEDILTPAKTGVYGFADQDDSAVGVLGQSVAGRGVEGSATTGRGVFGVAGTGRGVHGHSPSGQGVRGDATSGTGVYALASTGWALRAVGRVKLDKAAGIASIAKGWRSVLVDPGIALSSTSVVVATLRSSAGGSIAVHRVVVDATADTFRIYLTANATVAATVSWIVVN